MRRALNCKAAIKAVSVLIPVLFAGPGAAQNAVAPALEKWRPKDGIYAAPGKDFAASCDEANNIAIELKDKFVSGNEWGCRVTNVLDLDPSSIKVEMTCSDYNLANSINRPEDTQFKEILLLKRINPATISVHKSSNGKFKYPAWRAAYCPMATQRSYEEANSRAKQEAKQKAQLEQTLKDAHPRDGVYAAAGADFEERCAKFNDTVVTFSGKSIATASNICKIERTRVQLPDTVRIGADCALQPASSPAATNVQDWRTTPDHENLMFKKVDDRTVVLWIINDGHFTGDGRTLSYCSDQVQRAWAGQRRTGKQTRD
ncbi:hypothetical protein JQ543_02590 [Bradyrhizobium diazoefficiens]|nr:hypothetical protein [Bradyrhizobium diazoefficiens]MBR0774441.1 hypothetical protein [Bradyrhizobium diazoefficiens]MBR0846618.1 hypothetical protein [Bradyrhizobium diazoefficiens]